MRNNDEEWTYIVTQEDYDAEIVSGLTDEEVLKPGIYKLRRNPWAEKMRKVGKVKVSVTHEDRVVEQFWLKVGSGEKSDI